ncbi:MAG: hypothetical protein J6S04_00340, partial [Clostridia bacterium]|nr:hypothetical protein [Clostridia bacterium]
HKFSIPTVVKLTPFLSMFGFLLFGLSPFLFSKENIYLGLAIATVIFSAASGLNEALISPIVAELPSENPEREMSKLHSVYAWGTVAVIIISTLFLFLCDKTYWFVLPLFFIFVPLLATICFFNATLPPLPTAEKISGAFSMLKNKALWLCLFAIFVGGSSEVTMAQWCSSYLEQLGIDKIWGDVFGAAAFAVTLGIGRTLYAKYGNNIEKVLFLSGIGATVCYLVCIISPCISPWPIVGLIACAMTGLCTAMMWPGSLVVASNKIPSAGVFVFALMAAGGDMGAALGPQLVGIVTDTVLAFNGASSWAQSLGLTHEQLAMKLGLLVGHLFPLVSIFVFLRILRQKDKTKAELPLKNE